MRFPKFTMSQLPSSYPTGPTTFVEIPKIPDKELERICALSTLHKELQYAPTLRKALEDEYEKIMKPRSYMRDEISRYIRRVCPSALADLLKPRPPAPPPPPPPPAPPRPDIATPGTKPKGGPPSTPPGRPYEPEHWRDICDLALNLTVAIGRERIAQASGRPAEIAEAKANVVKAAKELEKAIRGKFDDQSEVNAFLEYCDTPILWRHWLPAGRGWWIKPGPTAKVTSKPLPYPTPSVQPIAPKLPVSTVSTVTRTSTTQAPAPAPWFPGMLLSGGTPAATTRSGRIPRSFLT